MPPSFPDDRPIVLFDGVCNLCTDTVRFIISRDPEGTFYFASLQSAVGQERHARFELATDELDSFVLVEGTDTTPSRRPHSELRNGWAALTPGCLSSESSLVDYGTQYTMALPIIDTSGSVAGRRVWFSEKTTDPGFSSNSGEERLQFGLDPDGTRPTNQSGQYQQY